MSFSQMVRSLREGNKGTIIFINAGAFYPNWGRSSIGRFFPTGDRLKAKEEMRGSYE